MLPPINLRGHITLAEGSITGIDFQNLKAVFSLINGLAESQQTVQLFGGAYQGHLTANLAQVKPDYQLEIKLADMQADDMVTTLTSAPHILFGLLNTDLAFSGKGFAWEDISTTATGSGKLNLNDFKLTTLDIMPKLAKSLAVISTVAGFTVPDDLSTRSFDQVKATLRLKDGKVNSDDLKLSGPDVQLLGTGMIGLDSSLAFDGIAVLLGQLATSLGQRAKFLMDNEGRITIPLAIQGTVTQPRIALNETHLTDLAQRAVTQQVKEKGEKEVEKLLNKVLPGDKRSDKPADSPSPLKELDKTLKGLFNR
jgi:AsmA protein